jgi:hypothetical protein
MTDTGNWIAVASAEHVRVGRAHGFMQVCHGKGVPLRRVLPGHRVVYYSPTVTFGARDKLQAFTALGVVKSQEPYQFDMGGGFHPFRRDVSWNEAHDAPIQPLLQQLEFAAGQKNWGQKFRYGLFSISDRDMGVIAAAMGAHFTN